MVSKCANPRCSVPFLYLRDGKVFQLEMDGADDPQQLELGRPKRPHRVEHFWLCGDCAAVMTLAVDRGRGVVTVPLYAKPLTRAAAS